MLIPQTNNHVFICGITQSGKSYFAHRALLDFPGPVLYLNIQGEDVPARFCPVCSDELGYSDLSDALHSGVKIDFHFRNTRTAYSYITDYLLTRLLEDSFSVYNPVYVAIDECHLLSGPGLDAAKQVATMGLKKGVRGVFITQRPANCDKTLYTQAAEQYIFYLAPSEQYYLKTKGIDYDECVRLWGDPHAHNYIKYDGYSLTPCPAIK